MNNKGLFLVLEGGEGVGKTTNMQFIEAYLQDNSVPFERSREPGGTPLAERIRELILAKHDEPVSDIAELLLVFAARAQHLEQKIIPCLERGDWMVCDRFTDATYAYQGGGRQLDKSTIAVLESLVQEELRPDCVIVLDASVEIGRSRAEARAELDRMESEALDFHQRVRDAYIERSNLYPQGYAVIDASQSLEDVQKDIKGVLDELIQQWRPND